MDLYFNASTLPLITSFINIFQQKDLLTYQVQDKIKTSLGILQLASLKQKKKGLIKTTFSLDSIL